MKPCPFCGSQSVEVLSWCPVAKYMTSIACRKCHGRGPYADTEAEAREKWENRGESELLARASKLAKDANIHPAIAKGIIEEADRAEAMHEDVMKAHFAEQERLFTEHIKAAFDQELSELEQSLIEVQAERDEAQKCAHELGEQVQILMRTSQKHESRCIELDREVGRISQWAAGLEDERDRLRAVLEEATEETDRARAVIMELKDLRDRYDKLEAFAEMRDAGHDDLRTENNKYRAFLARLKAANASCMYLLKGNVEDIIKDAGL